MNVPATELLNQKQIRFDDEQKVALDNLREANKLLRNQASTVAAFTLLALGLMYVADPSDDGSGTIGILGLSVPVKFWFFAVPVVLLALFHNFVELAGYRARILSVLGDTFDDWKQGPYLCAYRSRPRREPGDRYQGMISSAIRLVFFLAPTVACFLFIMESYNFPARFRAGGEILALNWTCLIVIVLDGVAFAYREDLFRVQTLTRLFIGGGRN